VEVKLVWDLIAKTHLLEVYGIAFKQTWKWRMGWIAGRLLSSPFLHGQVIFNIFHPFFISVIVGGRIASGNYIIAIHSISNHES